MVSILTDAELVDLWATWEESLIGICQITAAVKTPAGSGYTSTWPAVTATVSCALEDVQAGASGLGGEIDILSAHDAKTIWLPRGTSVKAADHIDHSGTTYEVARVTQPGEYGPGIACICTRLP